MRKSKQKRIREKGIEMCKTTGRDDETAGPATVIQDGGGGEGAGVAIVSGVCDGVGITVAGVVADAVGVV
jgi:hypothetical protein